MYASVAINLAERTVASRQCQVGRGVYWALELWKMLGSVAPWLVLEQKERLWLLG